MLRISKLTDYATVIMSYLALDHQRVASAAVIAKEVHLALPTVSKILKILLEAHLVVSFRGTGGGYQLARAAQTITLADVVAALEGNLAMTQCCNAELMCAIDSLCALKENWQMINKMIFQTLASVSLHTMLQPLTIKHLHLKGIPIVTGADYVK